MTRGYLKLTESSNFLQGNPINWPGTGQNWQEELRKFLARSYANREDTQRGMLDECKFLGDEELKLDKGKLYLELKEFRLIKDRFLFLI